MQGRLLLDVVVGEGAAVLELLAGEDEALLVGGDALLVLFPSYQGVSQTRTQLQAVSHLRRVASMTNARNPCQVSTAP